EHLELALFGETATSVSMASGTGLLDQDALRWDAEALAAAGIEPAQLFPLAAHGEGRRGLRSPWAGRWPALRSVPWFPAVGDGAPDAHGLTVLPFLAGERAPGWRADRRAAITGLSLDTTALDVVQAALEAVALRLALVYALLAPRAAADHLVVASGGAISHSR